MIKKQILEGLSVSSGALNFRLVISVIFPVILMILIPSLSYSSELWVARYHGPGNGQDEANAIAVDEAGNVYVTGDSYGSHLDFATIKYDADGKQLWEARYNGPGDKEDVATAIAVDASGNVYVTGYSDGSGDYTYDYATIKYDASGNQLWAARYDGPGNGDDRPFALAVDAEGSVYVTGYSYGGAGTSVDYATVKYGADGNQQWVARYNLSGNSGDYASALTIDKSGNIYVTGSSYGSGTSYDFATIKYDTDGNEQWAARYNGPASDDDFANAIALDAAGNVCVTGSSYRTWRDISSDYATVKYNADGDQQWVARYNGPGNDFDEAKAVAADAAGNFYVAGNSKGDGTGWDYSIIKYDADGSRLWEARYNGPANRRDEVYAIAVNASGNVYVTGRSHVSAFIGDYVTVKYNTNGRRQWVARYDGPVNDDDGSHALAIDTAGNVYVTGHSHGLNYTWDYATIKYSDDVTGCIDLDGSPLVNKKVILKQTGEVNQTTTTDIEGCYRFADAASGKAFTVQINGPVLSSPAPVIHGCADLQGSPMTGRKVLLKQKDEINQSTKTGADGCYSFSNAAPDKKFKLLIKVPVVP